MLARVSGEAEVAVDHLLGNAAELSLYRARFLKRWLQRAKELHKHEEDLRSKLPAHLPRVLASKRLLLWREMLLELGYKDAKVIDEIIRGSHDRLDRGIGRFCA